DCRGNSGLECVVSQFCSSGTVTVVIRNVTLVGTKDRALEDALRASGARLNSISAEALATFAPAPGRAPDALVIDLRGEDALPSSLAALKRSHPSIGI